MASSFQADVNHDGSNTVKPPHHIGNILAFAKNEGEMDVVVHDTKILDDHRKLLFHSGKIFPDNFLFFVIFEKAFFVVASADDVKDYTFFLFSRFTHMKDM